MERALGVGTGALAFGFIIVTSYGGILIDFSGNRFKEYVSIGGYKTGEWTTLPVIVTVKVISTSYKSTNTPNGISKSLSGKVTDFTTLIYANTSSPVLSFVCSDRNKAVRQAKYLAANLNADLILPA